MEHRKHLGLVNMNEVFENISKPLVDFKYSKIVKSSTRNGELNFILLNIFEYIHINLFHIFR